MRRAALALALLAPSARADEPGRLDVRAGRVEVIPTAPGVTELRLRDDVELALDRYRVRATRLDVRASGLDALDALDARDVVVEGDPVVAACPCDEPPVAFTSPWARFVGSRELYLRDARVLVLGRPVLRVPALWLRAPSSAGLLPPRAAWRGRDGASVGSGVFVPLGPAKADASVDVFTRGGAAFASRVEAPGLSAGARVATGLASLDGSAVRATLRGRTSRPASLAPFASLAEAGAGLAASVDVLRGPRAHAWEPELEVAATRFDHASLEGGAAARVGPAAAALVGGGLVARANREAQGPFGVGSRASGAIVRAGAARVDAADVALATLFAPGARVQTASAGASVEGVSRVGAIEATGRAMAGARGALVDDAEGALALASEPGPGLARGGAAAVELTGRTSVPLVRRFAGGLAHAIEPDAVARVGVVGLASRGGSGGLDAALAPGALVRDVRGVVAAAAIGGSTRLARRASANATNAIGAHAHAGAVVASAAREARLVVPDELRVRAGPAAAAVAAAGVSFGGARAPVAGSARAWGARRAGEGLALAVTARARLGAADAASMFASVAAQRGRAAAARLVEAGGAGSGAGDGASESVLDAGPWLDARGVFAGLGAASPIGPWLRARAETFAAWDARAGLVSGARPRVIGSRASVEVAHPCGCAAATLAASRRVGREGVDVWVTLELLPSRPARPGSTNVASRLRPRPRAADDSGASPVP